MVAFRRRNQQADWEALIGARYINVYWRQGPKQRACYAKRHATDCENKGANTSVIPAWGEADLTSNVAPYSVTAGTRVRSITIYPVAKNIDTGDYFIVPSISKGIIFAVSGQSEGIYLSKTQTASLINQMKDYIKVR